MHEAAYVKRPSAALEIKIAAAVSKLNRRNGRRRGLLRRQRRCAEERRSEERNGLARYHENSLAVRMRRQKRVRARNEPGSIPYRFATRWHSHHRGRLSVAHRSGHDRRPLEATGAALSAAAAARFRRTLPRTRGRREQ